MALRTFHANPCLGGFGGESGGAPHRPSFSNTTTQEHDCDAFAQIVKELVDNAVDACQHSLETTPKRIRVVIERMNDNTTTDEDYYIPGNHVLRVTVTDNGVGMEHVQACVNAFQTSKADTNIIEHTAGRYGIGLTLCLLHAQRLVPNSCASITSATAPQVHYTRASYVVDTDGDSVVCVKQETIPKTSPNESGTAVSLLVPGGTTAARAWPRLAEYFARFQLSLGLQCGLEVLAPSLSTIPLVIRPASQRRGISHHDNQRSSSQDDSNAMLMLSEHDKEMWTDGLSETLQVQENNDDEIMTEEANPSFLHQADDARRVEIVRAATTFLKRPVKIKNVAHASHPIGRTSRHNQDAQPTLEVYVIVYGKGDDDQEEEDASLKHDVLAETPYAKLMLVRMVNGVPLLDGAEASACGLVQGIVQKQSTWNSFGLHVTSSSYGGRLSAGFNDDGTVDSDDESAEGHVHGDLFVPTFAVRDSDQVAPFIQSGIHDLYHMDHEDDGSESALSGDDGSARAGRGGRNGFLPAHLRLGNILLIVHIHAKPSSLPLPTLSKGRLPMNNHPIGSALELGLMDCLGSLQKSSPGLLLTSTQLKETIRDTRYIPTLSAALALVVSKSHNSELRTTMMHTIQQWSRHSNAANPDEQQQQDDHASRAESVVPNVISMDSNTPSLAESMDDEDANHTEGGDTVSASTLGPLLERRLRLVCVPKKRTVGRRGSRRGKEGAHDSDSDDAVSLDEFLESGLCPEPESRMQEDNASAGQESFSEKGLSASSSSSSSSSSTTGSNVARNVPSLGRRLDPSEDNFDDDSWF